MSAGVLGLKAPPLTPRELFEGNDHYEIPPYQRPYVWDEDRQWAPLWADVSRVAERVAFAIETGDEPKVPTASFGAVVYKRKAPVVDGQQRMTTRRCFSTLCSRSSRSVATPTWRMTWSA